MQQTLAGNLDVDLATIRKMYPFRTQRLAMPGGALSYVDEGVGPPVVLLHGNPTWSFYYRRLISGLRDAYRVIAPDHMGCGLSDKPRSTPTPSAPTSPTSTVC